MLSFRLFRLAVPPPVTTRWEKTLRAAEALEKEEEVRFRNSLPPPLSVCLSLCFIRTYVFRFGVAKADVLVSRFWVVDANSELLEVQTETILRSIDIDSRGSRSNVKQTDGS